VLAVFGVLGVFGGGGLNPQGHKARRILSSLFIRYLTKIFTHIISK